VTDNLTYGIMSNDPLLRNWRGRRLIACRLHDALLEVIAHLGDEDGSVLPPVDSVVPAPPSDAMRSDLQNSATVLLRLILEFNDGNVSPQRLQSW
jgi:hypothetical protein